MTADHGHVVERRRGTQRSYPGMESGRSRAADGPARRTRSRCTGARVLTAGPPRRARRRRGTALRAAQGRLPRGSERRGGRRPRGRSRAGRGPEPSGPAAAAAADADVVVHPGGCRRGHAAARSHAIDTAGCRRRSPMLARRSSTSRSPRHPRSPLTLPRWAARSSRATCTAPSARSPAESRHRRPGRRLRRRAGRGARRPASDAARGAVGWAVSEVRLRGALAQVQQLLNVEGYAVLQTDPLTSPSRSTSGCCESSSRCDEHRARLRASAPRGHRRAAPRHRARHRAWTCSPSGSTGSSRRSTTSWTPSPDGGAVFKAVRGEYGAGKTFFTRWLAERAKRRGFAAAEVQISETETPLHRLETVYRRVTERCAPRPSRRARFRSVLDSWLFTLERTCSRPTRRSRRRRRPRWPRPSTRCSSSGSPR